MSTRDKCCRCDMLCSLNFPIRQRCEKSTNAVPGAQAQPKCVHVQTRDERRVEVEHCCTPIEHTRLVGKARVSAQHVEMLSRATLAHLLVEHEQE